MKDLVVSLAMADKIAKSGIMDAVPTVGQFWYDACGELYHILPGAASRRSKLCFGRMADFGLYEPDVTGIAQMVYAPTLTELLRYAEKGGLRVDVSAIHSDFFYANPFGYFPAFNSTNAADAVAELILANHEGRLKRFTLDQQVASRPQAVAPVAPPPMFHKILSVQSPTTRAVMLTAFIADGASGEDEQGVVIQAWHQTGNGEYSEQYRFIPMDIDIAVNFIRDYSETSAQAFVDSFEN